MNKAKISRLIVAAALTVAASASQASIVWDWSFGSNTGQFTTTGTAVGGSASAGSYLITDFDVLTSGTGATIGSMVGGQYAASGYSTNAPYSIVWNGSQVSSWSHSGGNSFNWTVFDDLSNNNYFLFGWQTGNINTATQAAYYPQNTNSALLTLRVANDGGQVPEPGSLALIALGLAAAGFAARRKA